jgi:hypothetical protein
MTEVTVTFAIANEDWSKRPVEITYKPFKTITASAERMIVITQLFKSMGRVPVDIKVH